MNPKVIAPIAGGVLGVGGVASTVTLWKTGNLGTTSDKSIVPSQSDQIRREESDPRVLPTVNSSTSGDLIVGSLEQTRVSQVSNNCIVVSISSAKGMFNGLTINETDYTAISCVKNTDKVLANQWTGLFPNELFNDEENLVAKKELRIITETEEKDRERKSYETTFISSELETTYITGTWVNTTDQAITTVTLEEDLESNKPIYLVFPERQS